jgi:predicted transposase YbfD/YdcC
VPLGSDKSHDTGRNRDETRIATVFDAADKLTDTEWRPHIKTIIQLQRRVLTRNAATGLWNRSTETAFYVSNTTLGATPAATAVRAHWGIENTSHYYSRDVTCGEDRSRIRTNPGVFARLRSFAFNILKANKTSTISQDRYRAALTGINNLPKLIAIPER